jgi:two-component system, LytTR family, sensor kinase
MKKPVSTLLQLAYWILYAMLLAVLFFLLTLFQRPPMSLGQWCRIMLGFAVIPGVIGFYSFYSFLFPYYLRTEKSLSVALLALLAALLAALAGMVVLTVMLNAKYLTNDSLRGAISVAVPITFIALVNGSIGFVIKGFESWFNDMKLKEELTRKNYEMELALVKSQLDPHFLFNTINNIDILIEKESVKASDYLNKLSDIMRFMLYETKTSRILLTKELAYIEKYIALQRLRTSNSNAISYQLDGDPGSRTIAPMLIIPFIENAFKHTNLKADGAVGITFTIEESKVVFKCENLVELRATLETEAGGLGKELMERRLALLYPGKYELVNTFDEQHYQVKLTVEE